MYSCLEDKEEVSALKNNTSTMPAIPRIYLHLFSRPVTRVKPQYNLAREVLGLLREERE